MIMQTAKCHQTYDNLCPSSTTEPNMDFLDFGSNFKVMLEAWKSWNDSGSGKSSQNDFLLNPRRARRRSPLDSTFLEVRRSTCVVGYNREAIQKVKRKVASLVEQPIALESFHVKCQSDITDGALLVPKIILVAIHYPGKKLIDEVTNQGQLDHLYDEVVEMGADLLVVYLNLPRSVYPPLRHMIYHPKMADLLFPTQSILRHLAAENCLITVTENSDLTNMQKNLIREWLVRPIHDTHPVFQTAGYLSEQEYSNSDVEFWSESEVYRRNKAGRNTYDDFVPATEDHPLANRRKKRKEKKGRYFRFKKRKPSDRTSRESQSGLLPLFEDREDLASSIELDLYHGNSYGSIDSYTQVSL